MTGKLSLHKQGKRNCVDNYHPISIVPAVAEVLERIIYDKLYTYISENDLSCNYQSEF